MYLTQLVALVREKPYLPRNIGKAVFFASCLFFTFIGGGQVVLGLARWEWGVAFLVCYFIRMFGVTLGNHRLATHASFETFWWMRGLFYIAAVTAIQGRVSKWAAIHFEHHADPDGPSDIHSPFYIRGNPVAGMRGLWHAFMGWFFQPPEFYLTERVRSRIEWFRSRDPVLRTIDKTYFVWILLLPLVTFLIGGFWMMIWANSICLCFTYAGAWLVNSLGHTGERSETGTKDHSRNVWWVAWPSGEGEHRKHHEVPGAANLERIWWRTIFTDWGTIVLYVLERLRLVWDVHWHWKMQRSVRT